MPHYDLAAYLADDALTLHGVVSEAHPDGASYTIASPSAKTALQLHRVMAMWAAKDTDTAPSAEDIAELVALTTGDDGEPVDFRVKLMGDAYAQMVTDKVSAERLDMIVTLVTTHYGSGAGVARMMVEAAAGEATARGNRATRRKTTRTAKKTAGSRSQKASTATAGSDPATTSPTSVSSNAPTGAGEQGQATAV